MTDNMDIQQLAEIYGDIKKDLEYIERIFRARLLEAQGDVPVVKLAQLSGLSRQTIYNWSQPIINEQKNTPQGH